MGDTEGSSVGAVYKKYIIVDIDGTVALHHNPDGSLRRGHHEYERVDEDLPNWPVINIVNALAAQQCKPIFLSGRPEDVKDGPGGTIRQKTLHWLDRWGVSDASTGSWLYMRKQGDFRSDDIVKRELFTSLPAEVRDRVIMAFDDRPRVLRLWRDLGIYAVDVQPFSGEF